MQSATITEQTGSAMILDEVVTGFRLAPGGVQEYLGIRADMCTYGKVIGGGHPIGVLSGKAQYLDALDGGAWQYGDDSGPRLASPSSPARLFAIRWRWPRRAPCCTT